MNSRAKLNEKIQALHYLSEYKVSPSGNAKRPIFIGSLTITDANGEIIFVVDTKQEAFRLHHSKASAEESLATYAIEQFANMDSAKTASSVTSFSIEEMEFDQIDPWKGKEYKWFLEFLLQAFNLDDDARCSKLLSAWVISKEFNLIPESRGQALTFMHSILKPNPDKTKALNHAIFYLKNQCQWIKDLTTEGVEPNPGPPKPQVPGRVRARRNMNGFRRIRNQLKNDNKKLKKEEKHIKVISAALRPLNNARNRSRAIVRNGRIRAGPQTSKVDEMKKVMLTICCPAHDATHEPVRFSDAYTNKPTAVAAIKKEMDVAWPKAETTNLILNPGEMSAVIFKDPVRNTVIYDSNTEGEVATYDYNFQNDPAMNAEGTRWLPDTVDQNDVFPTVGFLTSRNTNTWTPHGKVLGSGRAHAKSGFVPLSGHSSLQVTITNNDSNNWSGILKFWRWAESGIESVSAQFTGTIPPLGTYTHAFAPNLDDKGYFLFSICTDRASDTEQNDNLSLVAELIESGACFRHETIEDLTLMGKAIMGIRDLGVSLEFSNRTTDLYNGGTVAMAQVPPTDNWFDYLTYDAVTAVSGFVSFPAKMGEYGFIKTDSERGFELRQKFSSFNDDGTLATLFYNVRPDTAFVVSFVKVPDGNAINQVGVWQIGNDIEISTNSKYLQKARPSSDPLLYARASNAIKGIPQFHENPLHLKQIGGVVKQIADAIVKYGPTAIDWAQKIGTFVSAL